MTLQPPRIEPTLRLVAGFRDPLEKIFPFIAKQISSISNHLDGFSSSIESLAKGTAEPSLETTMGATQSLADELYDFVSKEEANYRSFSQTTNSMLQHLEVITQEFQAVDLVARRLRIAGLNASIISSRAGVNGDVLIVLSRELVMLTRDSEFEVCCVRQIVSDVREAIKRVTRIHDQMDKKLTQTTEETKNAVDTSFKAVCSLLTSTRQGFISASKEMTEIAAPIRSIMQNIQNEDILRQYLDHISMVLSEVENSFFEARKNNTNEVEHLLLQAYAGDLCVNLVDDISRNLDNLYTPTIGLLNQIGNSATRLIKTDQSLQQEDSRESLVLRALAPFERLMRLASSLAQEHGFSEEHSSEVGTIIEGIKILESHLHKLEQLSERLRNIRILLSLELDRSVLLARALAILPVITSARENLLERLAQISSPLHSLRSEARIMDQILNKITIKRQEQAMIYRALIQQKIATAQQNWTKFLNELSSFVDLGKTISNASLNLVRSLETSRATWQAFSELKDRCTKISQEAREQQRQLGHGQSTKQFAEIVPQKLRALAEKFTVLAHKEIAGNLGHWEVEAGDAGGSLTLF